MVFVRSKSHVCVVGIVLMMCIILCSKVRLKWLCSKVTLRTVFQSDPATFGSKVTLQTVFQSDPATFVRGMIEHGDSWSRTLDSWIDVPSI